MADAWYVTRKTLENYCSNPPNSVYKEVATNLHHYYTAEFLMQMRKVSSKKECTLVVTI